MNDNESGYIYDKDGNLDIPMLWYGDFSLDQNRICKGYKENEYSLDYADHIREIRKNKSIIKTIKTITVMKQGAKNFSVSLYPEYIEMYKHVQIPFSFDSIYDAWKFSHDNDILHAVYLTGWDAFGEEIDTQISMQEIQGLYESIPEPEKTDKKLLTTNFEHYLINL